MLTIQHLKPYSLEQVKSQLSDIHSRINPTSPFMTKHWQFAWASSLDCLPELFIFNLDANPVGYCWISKKFSNISNKLNYVLLNQTGEHEYDQVWIEHNGLIAPTDLLQDCYNLLFKVSKQFGTYKLYISMVSQSHANTHIKSNNLNIIKQDVAAFRTQLNTENMVAQFSRNTRSQIRRSKKLIQERYGEIVVTEAGADELELYLDLLAEKHVEKWGETKEGSGFHNIHFLKHHRYLLRNFSNRISLVKVYAGQTTIGYSYNLLQGDTVYFYCAGINYNTAIGKAKPGITMHVELMEYYQSKGFNWYDFLGGDARYKQSLSTHKYFFSNLSIYPNTVLGKLAHKLTLLKQKLS